MTIFWGRINSNSAALLYSSFLTFVSLSLAASLLSDTLTSSDQLMTNQTLISAAGKFELGFFSGNGNKLYLGIWYHNLSPKTIVWVANRDNPVLSDSAALLQVSNNHRAEVVVNDKNGSTVVWHSDTSSETGKPVVAQLLDNGNFVVRASSDDPDSTNFIWQSFDHPTDTLLPGQKLGWNLKTRLNRYITSWKTPTDPSTGNFSFKINPDGDPEIFLYRNSQPIYRSGPWVGLRFSGVPEMKPSQALNFSLLTTQDEVIYKFDLLDQSIKSRLVATTAGTLSRFTWVSERDGWHTFWYAPKDQCDNYMECGPYGVCDASALFVCECKQGFRPKNEYAWGLRDGSQGCQRMTELGCGGDGNSDGFLVMKEMKLPESGGAVVDREAGLQECSERCLKNCSCTAYASAVVISGVESGCVMFGGELRDLRTYGEGGQDLYVRLAASDLGSDDGSNSITKVIIAVCLSLGVCVLLGAVAGCFIWKRKKSRGALLRGRSELRGSKPGTERSQDLLLSGAIISSKRDCGGDGCSEDIELPLYDFETIVIATDNFSPENKLGHGGFGSVYKGVLGERGDVAVKRLSKESGQGVEEFKNEVKLIARLQHRNLVRLLGCCVDRQEKMLLYEYLQNRSLDTMLFHKERSHLLDWTTRFSIICGIARGLVYLHQDSRFRIIHRDLKASNILLDGDMNPKISDFGMARIFGGDESEPNSTRRVVGTYGYMSPEYAMDGIFSVKSDVFSFGVLVLEIVTGKKNRGFYNTNNELNLLGHAWKLWKEDKGKELLCSSVGEKFSPSEVLRCVQVGLLCVQERVEDRPTMSSVVLQLSSESPSLPQPKLPGFCMGWNPTETSSSSSRQDESFSVNRVTVTMIDGR